MTRTVSQGTREASPRQVAFLWRLAEERIAPLEAVQRLQDELAQHELGKSPFPFDKADRSIKWLLQQPLKTGMAPERIKAMPTPNEARQILVPGEKREPALVGVYKVKDVIYIVKESRQDTSRRYAAKLVVSPPRMTENGEEVDFEYVRAPGVVFQLTAADLMSEVDMKDFMIKYRKCMRCGHGLKAAKTLQRSEKLGVMVGKTCARKMGLIP